MTLHKILSKTYYMETVSVTFELPKWADDYYREKARNKMVSRSAVIREVLTEHASEAKTETPSKEKNGARK